MLETEIKALREEIYLMRKAFEGFTLSLNTAPATATPAKVEEPKKEVVKADTPPTPAPVAEKPKVSRDDLQALCMAIVRADRNKRDAIQAAIAKYDAKNLVSVKEEDLPALAKDLEVLK